MSSNLDLTGMGSLAEQPSGGDASATPDGKAARVAYGTQPPPYGSDENAAMALASGTGVFRAVEASPAMRATHDDALDDAYDDGLDDGDEVADDCDESPAIIALDSLEIVDSECDIVVRNSLIVIILTPM